jgi:hypothetical protein
VPYLLLGDVEQMRPALLHGMYPLLVYIYSENRETLLCKSNGHRETHIAQAHYANESLTCLDAPQGYVLVGAQGRLKDVIPL